MDLYKKPFWKKLFNRDQLTPSLQLMFLKRLYQLLQRGYSLNDALEIISWDKQLYDVVQTIRTCLFKGNHLDEALVRAKFHPLIVMYIYFVRINGDLISSLNKSIVMFEQRLLSLEKFKRVSRYPIILVMIFLFLLFMIRQYILPSYVEIFQFHATSAHTVNGMLYIFNFVITTILLITIGLFIILIVWKIVRKRLSIEKQIQIYAKLPIVRRILRMQTSFYFATYISLLLKAGLSMKHIIEHMEKQQEFPIIQYYASIMMQHLSKGYYLDGLLHSLPLIDRQLASLFKKHNHNDALQKDLATYADFIAEALEQKTMRAIMIIQPTTFSLLGIFIIFIYIALLWPMFQLLDSI